MTVRRFDIRNIHLKPHRLPSALALVALLGLSGASAFAQTVPAPPTSQTVGGRIKITQLAYLPPHTYAVSGTAADFVKDDAKMAALAAQVEVDIRHDLATYDIQDRSTLIGVYGSLNEIDCLRHNYPAILANYAQLKAQIGSEPDKPQQGLVSGALGLALLKSILSPGADFQKTLKSNLQTALEALPYEKVEDDLKSDRAKYEVLSEPVMVAYFLAPMNPAMQTGSISQDMAKSLLSAVVAERYILPNRSAVVAAFTNVIAEHKTVAKADIWPSRGVTLAPSPKLHPVLVGIWDSGVDLSLFPGRAWTDKDGTHGVAWTANSDQSSRLLYPLPAADQQYGAYFKGMEDLESGIDGPDAAAIKAKMASFSQDQVKPFFDGIEQYVEYAHGTHVAGIALRDNPAARLVVCRKASDSSEEDVPTVPAKKDEDTSPAVLARGLADELAASIAYFTAHRVPVVNISWHSELRDIKAGFEENQGGTLAEHDAQAKQVFDMLRAALFDAMKAAPDTLYVVGAGNDDTDLNFTGGFPSSFHLPNVLVVGAVDQAGDQTSFTSFGNVDVYADGFEVDSLLPGGAHAKLSGTSMAAPQVTNLAAKLLAVNPSLSVAQVKALIISTADARQDGGKTVRLINPKKAVAAAEKIHPSKKG